MMTVAPFSAAVQDLLLCIREASSHARLSHLVNDRANIRVYHLATDLEQGAIRHAVALARENLGPEETAVEPAYRRARG